VGELYPGATVNSSAKQQFPGGETEALKRLAKIVSAPAQKKWVGEFQKPKTSSTNVMTKVSNKEDWTTPSTSGLSPYLAMGCLSPRRFWHAIQQQLDGNSKHTRPPMSLQGQLLFREQFYVLGRSVENFDKAEGNIMCKDVKWGGGSTAKDNGSNVSTLSPEYKARLKAWQEGKTGYPYIDALMRQLNATGWMHHLGRHAVACFLTRGDLYLHWTHGRDYFNKKLLDGDWSLNNANWLWLAGVAPFSSPFFRVYSPTPDKNSSLNAEQTGQFVKFWVPELKDFPAKNIYEPSKAVQTVQIAAKCTIGKDYPKPVVEHKVISKQNIAAIGASLKNPLTVAGSGKRAASPGVSGSPAAKKARK